VWSAEARQYAWPVDSRDDESADQILCGLTEVRPTDTEAMDLNIDIADDLIERIAERAAELVADQQKDADGGWLRGADKIAAYIDAPRSRVYGLVSARRIPVHHDGAALIARRSELDAWLLSGGGLRP
jgi:hypothetical protein